MIKLFLLILCIVFLVVFSELFNNMCDALDNINLDDLDG